MLAGLIAVNTDEFVMKTEHIYLEKRKRNKQVQEQIL